MSDDISDPGHGNSPAAWTAVVIMLLGVLLGTIFFWLDMPALVWASGGVVLIGLIVGFVLAKAGYGVGGSRFQPKDH